MKTKKRDRRSRIRGRKTCGYGARKRHRGSGHRGGMGMAGTGKRADQKKTLVTKLYGNKYFGKQGITSKGTAKKKQNVINLQDIEKNLDSFIGRGIAKKTNKGIELNLENYKILGNGELKTKLTIKAKAVSKEAEEKIKKSGSEIILTKKKKESKEKIKEKKNGSK